MTAYLTDPTSSLGALAQLGLQSALTSAPPVSRGPLYDATQQIMQTPQIAVSTGTPIYAPPTPTAPWAMPAGGITGYAGGGYVHGGRAPSGYVRGPGDGKSDSIPVHTSGGALSSLSDGEFVFSAPAVANLGRGSNEAGARRLDKIHHALLKKDFHGALAALSGE